jgi:predicted alpha/beta hydrolase family esterase
MKKVYIVHGWDGSPEEPLFKWLDENLSKEGFLVSRLKMPNPKTPVIEEWLLKLKNSVNGLDEETIFVAHSVGCQAVMRFLENQSEETRILGMVLLAPWMKLDETTIEEEGEEVREIARPWMETSIDFEKVKNICQNIVAIFSDNDVFVELDQKDFFEKVLNAKTILEHEKGHFGPADNISELPSALKAIEKL